MVETLQTRRFQILPCAVEISLEDPSLARRLRYLMNAAEQPVRPFRTFRYAVTGSGPWEVREEGDLLERLEHPEDVLAILYRRCHQRAYHLLALGGWTLVHGAVVTVGGDRILITGDSGTGKSTLALHLLLHGAAVEGDELALVRDGQVVSLPRRFRLKPGTLDVVPALRGLASGLPHIAPDGVVVSAFDPTEAGYRWSLQLGPVDALVLAEPNHGSGSSLREIATADAFPRLLKQLHRVEDTPADRSRVVATASQLMRVPTFELRLGDLGEAVRALGCIHPRSNAARAISATLPTS
jgi:hypothetical protein